MMDRERSVKNFFYTDEILNELETSLSRERLRTYLDATGGDREEAIRLYIWNTDVSAAFYGPLQGLEVALRNAMHHRLAGRYGPAWYDNPAAGLDVGALDRLESARSGLKQGNPPQLVPALSFGFWVSLLGPGGRIDARHRANYEMTLWRPALRGVFAHRRLLTRRQAHRPLDDLRLLRNRIAHHEPIFRQNLALHHERLLDVTGWISPATRAWIEHHSRVPAIIESAAGGTP